MSPPLFSLPEARLRFTVSSPGGTGGDRGDGTGMEPGPGGRGAAAILRWAVLRGAAHGCGEGPAAC